VKRVLLATERERVAEACRRLAGEGLVLGTSGNVSARAGERIAITPTGGRLAELTAAEICVVDRRGQHVEGELAATSELALHLAIYERCDAGAVVHAHPPIGTALACVIDELPLVHYGMLAFGGSVRVAPYATFGSPELADRTVEALDGRNAALMANHGTVNFAADLHSAVENALLLEWACEVFWRASAIGTPRTLDAGAQQAVLDTLAARRYGTTHQAAP
jgi:L-fuculose-phosphate aldolase